MATTTPFDSERLHVFAFPLVVSEDNCLNRTLFAAYLKGDEHPAHVVTMTVINPMKHLGEKNVMVDWIQTIDRERRKGFAMEVCQAVEKHYGWELNMDGASDAGEAFCEAFYAKAEASK